MRPAPLALALTVALSPAVGGAQPRPTTRADAVAAAVARGARLALAASDTGIARALVLGARAFPNPVLIGEFTKSPPQYHVSVDIPVDYPWLRGTRIKAAEATRASALFRFRFERAASALDADTSYTRALATRAHLQLSARNAQAADSLRRITVARRDAGDASNLDVELATVYAGQQENAAAGDSLELTASLLTLQTAMGLSTDSVRIILSDSLTPPSADGGTASGGVPLLVAAAESDAEAAEFAARLERRYVWLPPSIVAGFETRDPTGDERGILPMFGIALPLPLLNWNRGPIALADAMRDRARAELTLARLEASAAITRAQRERDLALQRVARDQRLVASANGVATMSLSAYREGAASLPNVLEAQRNAREVLAQYIDDLASAWIALATARVLTLTATPDRPQ